MRILPCIVATFIVALCSFARASSTNGSVAQGGTLGWEAATVAKVPLDISLVSSDYVLQHDWQCCLPSGCFVYYYISQRGWNMPPIITQFWYRQGDHIGQSGYGIGFNDYPLILKDSGWCCGACALVWHCK